MKPWSKYPVVYEINTWVWLQELSQTCKTHVTLATVPAEEWDSIADLKVDAIWLLGVWERSPEGIAIANQNKGLIEDFRQALPDYCSEDNVGSPYCVRQYVIDEHLGGPSGLAVARTELARRGLKLILDFVPNHMAPDHPWVNNHPEYFVQGNTDDARNDPASFVETAGNVFARGRDPYFPAWPDVLQLNAFQPGLRQAVRETLADIADQCDGVRCDMAMLVIDAIFERTWGNRAGPRPATEYWVEVITTLKKAHPDFLFMAEAYWDLEWELQHQGFDYCYDKRLYDRLEHDTAERVRLHLCADLDYQGKLVRFIENHDEPRARSVFSLEKERAAAVITATIPGAKLFHEGQLEGRKVRLPVFLGRRPAEPEDPELRAFYCMLLRAASSDQLRKGHWQHCDRTGWPDNASYQNLVAWCWRSDEEHHLIIVNFSASSAQGLVLPPWDELKGRRWQMTDLFTEKEYERSGDEMCAQGLYVDLPPWRYHVLTRWLRVG
ncbi:alpha amylase catalytic subunit [Nitrosospira sp. Nsp2]|uniref:alpha-amylase family glycosyl hydrolase n=1 Tax=Nitrosospira sp. Nsp2 TaxID=136548 RepID=UPI000D306345|nr:alpha-amylase family glycosyl hydrolase [Nitrosospira sp. Nsp2]PTR17345.1 alpha amylase catalytic subunit [Nitrosospira sp. Nsp2]